MPRTLHAGRTVTLTLPLPPAALTANAARGQHWSASMLPAQTYRLLARAEAARARDALAPPGTPWTPLARCHLTLHFDLPDRRRRDWDNLVAAWKPAQDGLVEARLLADDSLAVIAAVTVTARLAPSAPGLRVTITELPPPGPRVV